MIVRPALNCGMLALRQWIEMEQRKEEEKKIGKQKSKALAFYECELPSIDCKGGSWRGRREEEEDDILVSIKELILSLPFLLLPFLQFLSAFFYFHYHMQAKLDKTI